jgi:hypothetical protein
MVEQVTIVAGDVSDESVQWFKAHGAQVEGIGLLTITLPEETQVQKGSYGWDYGIAFYMIRIHTSIMTMTQVEYADCCAQIATQE